MQGELNLTLKRPELSDTQKPLFNAVRRYIHTLEGPDTIVACMGRAAGKTFAATTGLLPEFFTRPTRYAFGAVTDRRGRAGWREIVDFCKGVIKSTGKANWRFAPAEDGLLESPAGGIFEKLSMAGDDAGRGARFHGAIFDELQLIKHSTFLNFLPALSVLQGLFIGLCTAPKTVREWNQSQWWIEKILMAPEERAEKFPNWFVLHNPTTAADLAFLTKQKQLEYGRELREWDYYMRMGELQLERLKRELTPEVFEREVEVKLTKPEHGNIFKSFRSDHIVDYGYNPDLNSRGGRVILGMDKGGGAAESVSLAIQVYQRPYAVGFTDEGEAILSDVDHYHIYDEYSTRELISSHSLVAAGVKQTKNMIPTAYPDPRASELHLALADYGIEYIKVNTPISDGLEMINTLLHQGRLTVSKNCVRMIQSFQDYSYNLTTNLPDDEEADYPDALRYALYNDVRVMGGGLNDGEEFASEGDGGTGVLEL